MLINEITPTPSLKEFVRLYRIVDFKFPAGVVIPPKAYPPRPEHCLQFMPRQTSRVFYPDTRTEIRQQKVMLIGQHTVMNNREVGKELLAIQVVLQPFAIFRCFGLAAHELNNTMVDADIFFGKDIYFLNEQLANTESHSKMISLIEEYLQRVLRRKTTDWHPIDNVFTCIGAMSMDDLSKGACLSYRQFDRKFVERTGISPKEFLRVTRFDRAFRTKNRHPEMDWLSIALSCGFYDYQHLTKDYKYFTRSTPVQFFAAGNAPERLLGHAET